MKSPLSPIENAYRGAIALNNIGVELLERGCYNQAFATLIDATTVMKYSLQCRKNYSSAHHHHCPVSPRDVTAMIERAGRRRSRPLPMESRTSYRILNLTDNHTDIVKSGYEYQDRLVGSIYPIRIDDVSLDLRCPGVLDDPDVHAAMILHNLGLVNLCLAQVCHDQQTARQQIRQAVSLFQFSSSILDRNSAHQEDELILRQAACVNMAVVSGLIQAISRGSVMTESMVLLLSRYHSLRSSIEMLDEILPDFVSSIHAASAA